MSNPALDFVRHEITFFMEKSFQFSFVYVGAVFAGVAGTKLDIAQAFANKLGTTPAVLFAGGVLVLNLIYLILASSCLFAIVKRVYFILSRRGTDYDGTLVDWERYLRVATPPMRAMSWKADYYYGVVLQTVIYVFSFSVFLVGWPNASLIGRAVLFGILLGHIIPIWVIWQARRLDLECRRVLVDVGGTP